MLSIATLLYSIALIPWLGPDPWMWRVWFPAWIVFTAIAVPFAVRTRNWRTPLAPWSAAVAFSIVAVLAAVMETRSYANVGTVFWILGIGMTGSVALFLMSYDRSKRPEAEVE